MVMLLGLWIVARIMILWWQPPPAVSANGERATSLLGAREGLQSTVPTDASGYGHADGPAAAYTARKNRWWEIPASPPRLRFRHEIAKPAASSYQDLLQARNPAPAALTAAPKPTDRHPVPPSALPLLPPITIDRTPFTLYAYAFHRAGSARAAVAGAGYGGSQAGAIAGYRIAGTQRAPVELIARLNYSPDDPGSTEPGIGLRWGPARGVSLAAEYRRRTDGTGTAIAYAAGGANPQPLPLGLSLQTYAQAGIYEQDGVHAFYDAQVNAMRPVTVIGDLAIDAGAGAWSGGTDQVQRLDVGPRLSASAGLGKVRVTLNADYRFRIAGNAAPGSGPAVTLAAGF